MNPRHAAGLVSLLASAAGLVGCTAPVRSDGRLFEHWADAVAAIPIDGQSHAAAGGRAGAANSGLRIDLVDRAAESSAKAIGLRAAMGVMNSGLAGLKRSISFEEPAAPAAPAAPDQTAAPGAYMAQIAAFPTREAAERGWTRLQASHPDVLGRLDARYEPVDLGGRGVWTRVQAGPFATRAQAEAVCSGIGAADRWCVTPRRD